jgi:hypothetical protein
MAALCRRDAASRRQPAALGRRIDLPRRKRIGPSARLLRDFLLAGTDDP